MKKVLLVVVLVMGLIGCTSGHPVPADVFKACIDGGGAPMYKSNLSGTKFVCLQPGDELTNF